MSADRSVGGGVQLSVNGDDQIVPSGTTVASLVAGMALDPRGIAVAVDGEVVPRRTWPNRHLHTGAQVEILTIAQGG